MRRPAALPVPRFKDPKDRRFVSIISRARTPHTGSVNVLGVPYDGAVLGQKGAAEGPAGVRAALLSASNYNPELGVDLLKAKVYDLGDVVVPKSDDVDAALARIGKEVGGALEPSSLLVVLGGDNSISLPSIVATAGRFRKVGLVVLDSHYDLRGRINGKPTSGSSYGLALSLLGKKLDPMRVVEIGAHGFLNSRTYATDAAQRGITLITAEQARRLGSFSTAKQAYQIASDGADAVYLSIDLDSVDIAWMPGVSAPSVGGMDPDQLNAMAYFFARQRKVVCSDLVELAPSLDPTGKSQVVASTALLHLVAGYFSR